MLEMSENGRIFNVSKFCSLEMQVQKLYRQNCRRHSRRNKLAVLLQYMRRHRFCMHTPSTLHAILSCLRQYKLSSGGCWSVQQVIMFRFPSCSLTLSIDITEKTMLPMLSDAVRYHQMFILKFQTPRRQIALQSNPPCHVCRE
jgi:hypothetical protein